MLNQDVKKTEGINMILSSVAAWPTIANVFVNGKFGPDHMVMPNETEKNVLGPAFLETVKGSQYMTVEGFFTITSQGYNDPQKGVLLVMVSRPVSYCWRENGVVLGIRVRHYQF